MATYTPQFSFINPLPANHPIEGYALGVFENAVHLQHSPLVDETFYQQVIAPLVQAHDFTGKEETCITAACFQRIKQFMLFGLGPADAVTPETFRKAAAAVYSACAQLKTTRVLIVFPDNACTYAAPAFAEGVVLTAHQDDRFKSTSESPSLRQVQFGNTPQEPGVLSVVRETTAGVLLARELVNAPANYVTPRALAEAAQTLAETYALDLKILDQEACEQRGMGAYLGVSQGSALPPQFIHLCYKPQNLNPQARFKKIALIGKGLTFDSGGLNLKVGRGAQIELMKCDMAGAAAVLGAARVIAALQPAKEVHFIIAATENMIGSKALHPGDIVKASNGKTIEVDNTDAEGRLTLADALVYAEKLHVDAIVDLATLTGSIVIALGAAIAGVFSSDAALLAELLASAQPTGEKLWHMPLEESYFKGMNSIVADVKNTGDDREAGAVMAALFLKQFVQKTPWAHLDIAGVAWSKKKQGYNNPGATGFGVRLLVDWIMNK